MPLGSLCTSLAVLVGVQPASTWAGNTDVSAVEIMVWVNEAQRRVADEADWQTLLRDGFGDLVPVDGYADEVALRLPDDCDHVIPDSVWMTRLRRKVRGPLTLAEWEFRRSAVVSAIDPVFTVSDGTLLVRATSGTSVSDLVTLRYAALVPDLTADGQASALGVKLERLILLCAVVLYRDAKGLPVGTSSQQYLSALQLAKARDQPVGVMTMGRRWAVPGAVMGQNVIVQTETLEGVPMMVATGSTAMDAAVLTAAVVVVTTVPMGSGVKLSSLHRQSVINRGANPLVVYPPSGGSIEAAGSGILQPGAGGTFVSDNGLTFFVF